MVENSCATGVRVSVIIPTFNRGHLLTQSIESVLNQQGSFDIEVIVIDDGSTDNTGQIVQELDNKRVKYYYQDHHGACVARNYGLDMATGDYIALQDSDDVWHEDKLRKQIEKLITMKADIIFCAYNYFDDAENIKARVPDCKHEGFICFDRIIYSNMMDTATILGRKQCMKETRFDPSLPRWQDWDYALQLTRKYSVFYMPEVLVDAYLQTDSITKQPGLAVDAACILMKKYREEMFKDDKHLDGILNLLQMNKNQMLEIISGQQNQIEKQNNQIHEAHAEIDEKKRILERLNIRLEREIENNKNINRHLQGVIDSKTWKVGRVITYIPRHVHSFLKKQMNE